MPSPNALVILKIGPIVMPQKASCIHPLSTLREGLDPFILSGSILRAWGNSNNSICPALLDLHQYNDESELPWKNANTTPFPGREFTSIAELQVGSETIGRPSS